jgi:O-antigen ligase
MTERFPKLALMAGIVCSPPILFYFAYSRPGYFNNPIFLTVFLGAELMLLVTCLYRRVFLTAVLLVFLFAGMGLPFVGFFLVGRWFFLALGGAVGAFILLKERRHYFRLFHGLAVLAAAAALVSSAVSRYPEFALLRATSLLLLFLYAGTGARLAVSDRENRFVSGLVLAAEIFVGATAVFYLAGIEVMGNPNSLGAVMAVFAVPVLLWSTLIDDTPAVHNRRMFLFAIAMYLIWYSRSRASLLAVFVSCSLLCLCLRQYKLFGHTMIILLILGAGTAIFHPESLANMVSSTKESLIYKNTGAARGVFASRLTPWENAKQSIHEHFWFGSGFGTVATETDTNARGGTFTSNPDVSSENGSSYLSILSWLGVLGALPFALLLLSLLGKIVRTCLWMLNTASPYHLAIPLAMVVLAGLTDAAFEDWLLAPGYYLCVFVWSMAFILVDYAPWATLPSLASTGSPWLVRQQVSPAAPIR